MKKFYLFTIALLSVLSLNARTLYLQPNENWKKDGARFAVYGFVDDNDNNWYSMESAGENVYKADVDDKYGKIIFVRMNGGTTDNNWDNKWNQTDDLEVPSDGKNMYSIAADTWDKGGGEWSVYNAQGGGDNGNGNGNDENNGGNNGGGIGGGDDESSLEGWFYKGYIDGKDVEPSAATRFVKGKASFACEQKSYVFVLFQDANGGVQYMTQQYVEGESHASLYKGIDATGNKMAFEPGMYTLYLYDNEDGSYELSCEELPGKKLVGAETNALEETLYSPDMNAPMHNILGQKVEAGYRGIVIQNNRKYVIR